jgi:hypothetical protein
MPKNGTKKMKPKSMPQNAPESASLAGQAAIVLGLGLFLAVLPRNDGRIVDLDQMLLRQVNELVERFLRALRGCQISRQLTLSFRCSPHAINCI